MHIRLIHKQCCQSVLGHHNGTFLNFYLLIEFMRDSNWIYWHLQETAVLYGIVLSIQHTVNAFWSYIFRVSTMLLFQWINWNLLCRDKWVYDSVGQYNPKYLGVCVCVCVWLHLYVNGSWCGRLYIFYFTHKSTKIQQSH